MPTPEKEEQVRQIRELIETSTVAIATNNNGLSVADMTELRRVLRENGVRLRVVKNTLAHIAADQAGAPEVKGIVHRSDRHRLRIRRPRSSSQGPDRTPGILQNPHDHYRRIPERKGLDARASRRPRQAPVQGSPRGAGAWTTPIADRRPRGNPPSPLAKPGLRPQFPRKSASSPPSRPSPTGKRASKSTRGSKHI